MSITTAEIAQLWRQANRQMRELFRTTVKEYELPPTAYLVLRHIKKEPGITVSELARRLGTAKSHVSNVTEQLVREGYVERRTDPTDQRILKLHLTPLAFKRLETMGDRSQAIWTIVFEEFPEAELEEVAQFLQSLLSALERANARINATQATDTVSGRGG